MAQFIALSMFIVVLLAASVSMAEPRKITASINTFARTRSSDEEFSSLAPSPQLSNAGLKQYNYVKNCETQLTDKCGEEIYKYVFENSKSYTDDCCDNLVALGHKCHIAMVEYYVELSHLQVDALTFFGKGELIWNNCYNSIFTPTPAPSQDGGFSDAAPPPQLSPEETAYNQYLENCAATLTEKCEEEVFNFVFENSISYSIDCCKKLVATGRKCHVDMIDYSVEQPQYKSNASVAWAKSDQIWNKCSLIA